MKLKNELKRAERFIKEMKADTPEGLLKWILAIVQTPPSAMPKEDWLLEALGVAARYSRQAGVDLERGKIPPATKDDASRIINRWTEMLRDAISHKLVSVGPLQSEPILTWSDDRGYREWEATDDFLSLTATTLKCLILDYGQLLKACDAPKPRSKEKCGKWFLASRTSQLYHSPGCASRVSTRLGRKERKNRSRN